MAPECSHMTTICHFPFWFQWKHLSCLPKLWNFHLVDSKCFQIKFITNRFFFTGRCHFQLSNIRITKGFWLAGDDDYLRGATSINHQVALRANFKMYSRSAKGGEKGDPNRNPWLAKMCLSGRSYSWQLRLESSHIASVLSRFTLSPAHSGNLLGINNHWSSDFGLSFCLFIYLWVLTFPLLDCSEFGNFVITLII